MQTHKEKQILASLWVQVHWLNWSKSSGQPIVKFLFLIIFRSLNYININIFFNFTRVFFFNIYHNSCNIDMVSLTVSACSRFYSSKPPFLESPCKTQQQESNTAMWTVPLSQNVQYWETAHMQRLRPLIGCGRSLAQAWANEGPLLFVLRLVRCYKTAAAMRDEEQRHSKHTKDARSHY